LILLIDFGFPDIAIVIYIIKKYVNQSTKIHSKRVNILRVFTPVFDRGFSMLRILGPGGQFGPEYPQKNKVEPQIRS